MNEVQERSARVLWGLAARASSLGCALRFRPGAFRAFLVSAMACGCLSGILAASAAAPPNDKFASAQLILGVEGSTTGSNAGATSQPGEPVHAGTASGKSVWYRWHPPFDIAVTFSTEGSVPDTVIAVYTGFALGALTPVASNDDATPGSRYASVSFKADDSIDYWIAVDSRPGDGGPLSLTWSSTPSNDRFTSFRLLDGSSGMVRGSSAGAGLDPDETPAGGSDVTGTVWFAWPSSLSGDVTFDTMGSEFDTVIAIYVGDDLGSLSLIGADDNSGDDGVTSLVMFHADPGGRYRIAIGGRNGARGTYRLTWRQTLPPPDNDDLSAARLLSGTTGEAFGSVDGATAEVGEPPTDGRAPTASVWFRWTAPRSETVFFTAQGSLFASELSVYTGTDYTDLSLVAMGEDLGAGQSAFARFEATEGTTYLVSLDSEDATVGAYTLAWNYEDLRTPNNEFARARKLIGFSGRISGENYRADNEPGEPMHAGDPGGRSVWYRWPSPADFRVIVETAGSNFDTLLAVYTGEDLVSGLTLVASNDDFDHQLTSRVTFDARAGVAYYIAVDSATDHGFKVAEIGAIELAWRPAQSDALIVYPSKGMVGTRICIGVGELEKVKGVTLGGLAADFYLQDGALNVLVPPGATTGAIEVTLDQGVTQTSSSDFVVLPGSPPTLAISAPSASWVRLSWPSQFPDFVLQWTDDLSDSGIWRLGPSASLVGGEWRAELAIDPRNQSRFYRLAIP
ncbi:MAG: hypothetical protein HYR88_09540 [Verrucomicrobia bacterium]|nr:hypothetical protein [Verrucomicrobiota bacterium]MBI3867158.1 hypothetical protein [Verrucomicrobiota bacterium]